MYQQNEEITSSSKKNHIGNRDQSYQGDEDGQRNLLNRYRKENYLPQNQRRTTLACNTNQMLSSSSKDYVSGLASMTSAEQTYAINNSTSSVNAQQLRACSNRSEGKKVTLGSGSSGLLQTTTQTKQQAIAAAIKHNNQVKSAERVQDSFKVKLVSDVKAQQQAKILPPAFLSSDKKFQPQPQQNQNNKTLYNGGFKPHEQHMRSAEPCGSSATGPFRQTFSGGRCAASNLMSLQQQKGHPVDRSGS